MLNKIEEINIKYAVLMHIGNWPAGLKEIELDHGIVLLSTFDHPVGKLYRKICVQQNIDHGEPYAYDTTLLFENGEVYVHDIAVVPRAAQFSYSTIIINILVALYKASFDACRVIASGDNFETLHQTYELYDNPVEEMDVLVNHQASFDRDKIEALRIVLSNLKSLSSRKSPRIHNALHFFYLSWNTLTVYQTAICLSVVMETLFSPNSTGELVHQIAYNCAEFAGIDKNQKTEVYKVVKKFYGIRSKLVHGNAITGVEEKLIPTFFTFIAEILTTIMKDKILMDTFNDNAKRKLYFDQLLFK